MNNFISKELENVLKKTSGQILCIGINDGKLLDIIDKNDNIIKSDMLDNNSIGKSNNVVKSKKTKTVSIHNIKNIFGKKKIDTVICNYKHIEMYLKSFVKDSIYICKGNFVLFGELKKDELNKITDLYSRYDVKNIVKNEKNSYLITFEINNIKTSKIKDFIYSLKDRVAEIIDIITDLLIG